MPRPLSTATVDAMIDDIRRATRGRRMRWLMVDEVAQRLRLEQVAVDAAIRQAEAKSLLIAEESPVHSVCLTVDGRRLTR